MFDYIIFEANKERLRHAVNITQAVFKKAGFGETRPICVSTKVAALQFLRERTIGFSIAFISLGDVEQAATVAMEFRKKDLRGALVFFGGDFAAFNSVMRYRPSAYVPDITTADGANEFARAAYSLYMEQVGNTRFFVVKRSTDIVRVAHSEIEYFVSDDHRVTLYEMSGEPHIFTGKLDDAANMLHHAPNFIRCHKSYIVNYDNMAKYDRSHQEFLRKNGQPIKVSKSHVTAVREYVSEYDAVHGRKTQ